MPRREQPEAGPQPISFKNLIAVRACYWNAVVAALFSNLPWTAPMSFLWFFSAGLFSSASYERRTGFDLSVRDGMKLGAIAGTLTFAMWFVLFAVQLSALEGGVSAVVEEQARQFREAGQSEQADMLEDAADEPVALALGLLAAVGFIGGVTIGFSAGGGALGAKMLGRRRAP